MPQPPPTDEQFFTLRPVQPPQPKPAMSWGIPIFLGLIALPILMFVFGIGQQQKPTPAITPTPQPSTTTAMQASPTRAIATPQPNPTATPDVTITPGSDMAVAPVAHIYSPGMAANVRTAPTLHSQVLGVLMDGDLVELGTDRRVIQDGVTWVPVTFRQQPGWVASNFIGGIAHAQP